LWWAHWLDRPRFIQHSPQAERAQGLDEIPKIFLPQYYQKIATLDKPPMPDNNTNPLEEISEQTEIKVLAPSALEAIERAEIDIAIATAKRYPRDLALVKREMREMATKDVAVATSCSYALPRAGKMIVGPSVRMAEIVFSCFGNLSAGARIVSMSDEQVTCQAVCHDLQRNTRLALEIPRNIHASKKAKTAEDKAAAIRDAKHITSLAALKIGFREVIFAVVPRSLVTPIWKEAQEVAIGKGRTFDEARSACLEEFKKIGVSTKKVCEYLEIGGPEALSTAHLQILFGVLTSINEGETNVETEFGIAPKDQKETKEPVKAKLPAETPKPEVKLPEPKPEPAKPEFKRQSSIEEDFLPDLAVPKKTAVPKTQPPESKKAELDPVYARVSKKIADSGITETDFLRAMVYWGLVGADTKTLNEVRVGAMRAAESDWKAVLDEVAMIRNETAQSE
jgi:hypothetical protein